MRAPRTVRFSLASLIAMTVLGAGVAPSPAHAAGEFTVSPTSLNFPATFVGASASIPVVITNVSGVSQSPNFSGGAPLDPANFGGSQNCAGKTFAPGDTCSFTYTFEPSSAGSHSSSTTIGVGSENFAISMSGQGLFPFTVSPTTLAFPDTPVGQTSSIPVVITNVSGISQSPNFSGGAPLDPANFGGSQNCAGKTFGAGDTCSFTYEFTPTTAGPVSSSTTIGIDNQNFAISMSGTGTDGNATTTTSDSPTTTATATEATDTSPASGAPDAPEAPGDDGTTPGAPQTVTVSGGIQIVAGPLAGGPAHVIAQGVVEFPAGPVAWEHETLDPPDWPFAFAATPASFLTADGPDAVLVTTGSASTALLDAGEAIFVPAGASGTASPMFDGAVSTGRRITFVGATAPLAFTPGPARRDVNLIGATLTADERVEVSSPFPILVVVVEGEVTTADGQELPEGTVRTLPMAALHNTGADDAVVLLAAVGGPVP